jgi:hypothetical protein
MIHRKKVYVSRTIQGRLLAQLGFYFLLYNFLLWHATFLVETLPGEGVPEPLSQRYAEFYSQHSVWLWCMLAAAPVILWDMVAMTHRVAGPLVRLEHIVRAMARGRHVSKVTLRQNDMLGQFVEAINELIDAHNRQVDVLGGDDSNSESVVAGECHSLNGEPAGACVHPTA